MRLTRRPLMPGRAALQAYLRGMSLGFDPHPVSDSMSRVLSDEEAMWHDWQAVSGDLRAALDSAQAEDGQERGR